MKLICVACGVGDKPDRRVYIYRGGNYHTDCYADRRKVAASRPAQRKGKR